MVGALGQSAGKLEAAGGRGRTNRRQPARHQSDPVCGRVAPAVGGAIVEAGSIRTFTTPGVTAYSATKAAQLAMVQQLALKLGNAGESPPAELRRTNDPVVAKVPP